MSKPVSDQLYQLIHSLNQSEKRYFKRFLLMYGGKETASGKLFDAYSRQMKFDEAALKKSATYLSGFAQHKKRLSDLVMRSLRSYYSNANKDLQLKSYFMDSEILRQKRLYTAGIASLKKAEKLAQSTEDFIGQLDAAARIDLLLFDARTPGGFSNHDKNLAAELKLLVKIEELIRQKSNAKAEYFRHYFDQPSASPKKTKAIPAPKNNLQAERYYLLSNAARELSNGQTQKAYSFAAKHVSLIEKNTWLIEHYPYEYLKALSTQLVLEDILHLYKESAATIVRMRGLHRSGPVAKKLKQFESHTFTYTFTTELNAIIARADFSEAVKLIPQIQKGLEKYAGRITAAEHKVFYYNFSLLQLCSGDPKQAFRWAAKSLGTGEGNRSDLDYTLYLLRILSTFERNDPAFFRVLLKKETVRLKAVEYAPEFTAALVEFLQSLSGISVRKQLRAVCSAFFEKLKKGKLAKEMKTALPDFDLPAWLEGKMTGKTMAEILAAR